VCLGEGKQLSGGWRSAAEVGKVIFKINGDEALRDESVKKSNGDKAFNDNFS
jgi:hypothetical protein